MRITLTLLFIVPFLTAQSQKRKMYFPIWSFQQGNSIIYGISLGLWDFSNTPKNTSTNGLRISLIGEGIFVPLSPESPIARNDSIFNVRKKQSITEYINGINISGSGIAGDYKINGISLGLIGQIAYKVNGFSAAAMNFTEIHNGIQVGLFVNDCYKMNGIQIALFNNAHKTRGIQIGLWNVNEKRKLPFLNWNFRG